MEMERPKKTTMENDMATTGIPSPNLHGLLHVTTSQIGVPKKRSSLFVEPATR